MLSRKMESTMLTLLSSAGLIPLDLAPFEVCQVRTSLMVAVASQGHSLSYS